MVTIVAHLGGIDEIGIFVVPAVLAVLALRWAERRAQRRAAKGEDLVSGPEGGSTGAPLGLVSPPEEGSTGEGGEGGSPV